MTSQKIEDILTESENIRRESEQLRLELKDKIKESEESRENLRKDNSREHLGKREK